MSELFWEYLLGLIAEGRVVPVVGQDLLVLQLDGRSLTLYELLAERLAARLLPEVAAGKKAPPRSLSAVASEYLAGGGDLPFIYSALKAVMPTAAELSIPKPLLELASIKPFKLFVTTTFDSLLVRALRETRGPESVREILSFFPQDAWQDLPRDWASRPGATVFQLLGQLSAAPFYAVTEEDTLEFVHALQSKERRPTQLFNELTDRDLLLLGNSFPDWLARFFIRIGRVHRLSAVVRGKTDLLADDNAGGDPGLVLFLQHYSSQVKVYSDGGSVDFVTELHRRWHALATGQPGIAALAPSEEAQGNTVFISYAREDRAAAVEIKDALQAEKIPVWFDDSDIRAGDSYETKIKRAILGSLLFVPVISEHTVTVDRPRTFWAEWNYAIERSRYFPRNRNFILPVAIDDTSEKNGNLPLEFQAIHWLRPTNGRPDRRFVDEVRQAFRNAQ
jgi:TIR domain/SIR2-like domain